MNVLIGFVTTSEPGSERGPASIVTVAKDKLPNHVYLMYTPETEGNLDHTIRWLKHDPQIAKALKRDPIPVPLGKELGEDPTDYELLKGVIPAELAKIYKAHMGDQFHLVSGLVQVRIIFALSLFAAVIPGAIWEVNPPKIVRPPLHVGPPQIVDAQAAHDRLESLDTSIFNYFRILYEERHQKARLRLYLDVEQASLDGQSLRLKSRDKENRTFRVLALLACRKRHGLGDEMLSKMHIEEMVYKKKRPDAQFVHFVDDLNARAKEISQNTNSLLEKLIERVKSPSPHESFYRIVDGMGPADEAIQFFGNLKEYLTTHFGSASLALFPGLRG